MRLLQGVSLPTAWLCCLGLLGAAGACSAPEQETAAQRRQAGRLTQAYILREIYSGQYCFRTRFYWRDSLRNVRDICRVRYQLRDTVNHLLIELHGWQGRDCDTNKFLLVRQGSQAWFIPFCDEMKLQGETTRDTAFLKTNLVLTRPLNTALRGLALKDRAVFLRHFFDLLFPRGYRLTPADAAALLDARTKAYVRSRLGTATTYFYCAGGLNLNVVWEFDDSPSDGLRVRVIRPAWYQCFAM